MSRDLSQAEHDDMVRTHALRLLSEGNEVWARLDGWFDPPDFINGYRPDIVAKKGDNYQIVEIEKGPVDWPKIMALRQFVAATRNVALQIIELPEELRKTGT
jgi:hypothetical protein